MENMDKGPKIPQMPQNLSAQFVCPSPKNLDFNNKRLHCASVVRDCSHTYLWITGAVTDNCRIFFHIQQINRAITLK